MRQTVSGVSTPFIMIGLLFSLMGQFAQASPLAESVVEVSPLGAIAEQSPAMLRTGIRDGLVGTGQVDPFLAETIAGIGSRAFSPKQIKVQLAEDLAEDLDNTQLEAVRDWYDAPLGQRFAQAESRAASPDQWEAIRAAAPALRQQFEGSGRQQLFARYDRVTAASATAVETAMAVQLELAESLASLSAEDTVESIQAQIEDNRPAIERQVNEQVYLAFLSMYQSFPDKDLETYLQFLESPSGQAYIDSAGDAVRDAIMEPVGNVGNQLVRLLGSGGR